MSQPFCYLELHTQKFQSAKQFYGKLFSWELKEQQFGPLPYISVAPGEGPIGGMVSSWYDKTNEQWVPYVLVDDVTKFAAKAKELGATIVSEKTEVPQTGFFILMRDPSGAPFALWERIANK